MPMITKVMKPEEFTAQTVAELQFLFFRVRRLSTGGPAGPEFSEFSKESQQEAIDQAQFVLDGLKARGIIG